MKAPPRVCQECGEQFRVKPSVVAKGWGKFCSPGCAYAARKGENNYQWIKRDPLVCGICSKEFYLRPCDVKRGRGKFCSRACYSQHLRTVTGDKAARWMGGKVACTCETCGAKFELEPSRVHYGRGRFCSRVCHGEYQKTLTGEQSAGWRGGKSFETYPQEFSNSLKAEIRARDGNRCQLCTALGDNVHHIDYDKNNCLHINLITLCSVCHCKTNYNRGSWEAILSDKMTYNPFNGFMGM